MSTKAVFIKHPIGIKCEIIEELLRCCGPLHAWKPQLDPSTGQPKNFGFAEFLDMSGVARTVRILSPIRLPDSKTGTMQPLTVRVDKSTSALLEIYNKSNVVNFQEDDIARQKVGNILRSNFSEAQQEDTAAEFLSSVLTTEESKQETIDHVDIREQKKYKLTATVSDENEFNLEEEAKKREERRIYEQKRIFDERLEKFEVRRSYRARVRESHMERDKERDLNAPLMKQKTLDFYAAYDDDEEEKAGKDDWYIDRDHWIEKRRIQRKKEEMFDEKDREMEQKTYTKPEKIISKADKQEGKLYLKQLKQDLREMLKSELKILYPLNEKPVETEDLFKFPIDWSLLTQMAVKKKITPIIDAKITQFLGESEPDLVEYVLDTILPSTVVNDDIVTYQEGKNPQFILEEISSSFGDTEEEKKEAQDLIVLVWKAVIWEVEKKKYVDGREIIGLEGSLEELEINHVL